MGLCLQCRRPRFDPLVGKIPWRREWLPTLVFLPGKFRGHRGAWWAIVYGVTKSKTEPLTLSLFIYMRTAIRRENKWKQKITHQTSFAALLFRWLIWGLGQNWKRRI